MPIEHHSLIEGTTSTAGTGPFVVSAVAGRRAFSVLPNGTEVPITRGDAAGNFEAGYVTVSTVGGVTTLTWTERKETSNGGIGGAAVTWPGGGAQNVVLGPITTGTPDSKNAGSEYAGVAAAFRGNIGLGTAAVLNVGTGANQVVQRTASGAYPAGDGALLTNLPPGTPSVPAGAVTDWYNTAAPDGWERVTTVNDRVPIIVSAGSPGTMNTETWNIEALTASGHSLTAAEIPGHTHDIAYSVFQGGSGGVGVIETIGTGSSQASTTSVGGGNPHTHEVVSAGTWRVPGAYMLMGRKL